MQFLEGAAINAQALPKTIRCRGHHTSTPASSARARTRNCRGSAHMGWDTCVVAGKHLAMMLLDAGEGPSCRCHRRRGIGKASRDLIHRRGEGTLRPGATATRGGVSNTKNTSTRRRR